MILRSLALSTILVHAASLKYLVPGWGEEEQHGVSLDRSGSLHLPANLDIWQECWVEKLQNDAATDFPPAVKLVLGVFSMEEFPNRDFIHGVIRETWMNLPGVCWLNAPKPHCSVFTAFILGQRNSTEYKQDEIVLNTTENMNGGKSFDFFRHAADSYPWATHIAKMDLDAFPYLHKLTNSLFLHLNNGCEHYVGRAWQCQFATCPPKDCGMPVAGDFLRYDSAQENCWSFMQGGLYVLSAGLAKDMTAAGSEWGRRKVGREDVVLGEMVAKHGREVGLCVSTWDPEAYFHYDPYVHPRGDRCWDP